MTLRFSYLILSVLVSGSVLAQSPATTRPSVRPPATRPAETTPAPNAQSIGDAANRQQELYDQHHGIKRKPTNPVTSAPPVAADNRPVINSSLNDESNVSGVRIGLRGGVTLPVYLEKQIGVEPNLGFVGGVSFTFGKGGLAFQPEINYARLGVKADLGFTTATAASDYVQVPLLLKFQTGTYAGSRFFVNVGPYGSYVLSGSLNGRKIDLTGFNGRFGFGGALGVGAALKAGPGHVTIEVRGLYELGDTDNGFNANSKTILSQATLGYIVPLGGR